MDPKQLFGTISPPPVAAPFTQGSGQQGIQLFVTNIINILYAAAALVFVFMVIISGFQWLTSGGDKEAISKARSRLTYSIIGIAVLALTFVILNILGGILNFHFFHGGGSAPLTGSSTPTGVGP